MPQIQRWCLCPGVPLEITWSHEAGFSVSGAGKASWISGSYIVTWFRTEADYAHCSAKRGENVCVSHWMRCQEYTVERADWNVYSPSKEIQESQDQVPSQEPGSARAGLCQGEAAAKARGTTTGRIEAGQARRGLVSHVRWSRERPCSQIL